MIVERRAAKERFDDWVWSLDHPMSRDERIAFVAEAKNHPSATTPIPGWTLVSFDDTKSPVMEWIAVHDDAEYSETLVMDVPATGESHLLILYEFVRECDMKRSYIRERERIHRLWEGVADREAAWPDVHGWVAEKQGEDE